MTKQFTYNKKERLKSQKQLDELFNGKNSFLIFPIKILYSVTDKILATNSSVQCGVGVSKRNFKKAVHRNRIKRIMREAYRLNKTELYNSAVQNQKQVNIFLLYIDKQLPTIELLMQKQILINQALLKHL